MILHVLNGALALLLFRSMLLRSGVAGRQALAGAAVGAALFALHPLRVESVVWITERRDLVSGLFALLATSAYVRATDSGGSLSKANSACPRMPDSRLLKSWAMPPARTPKLSSF